MKLDSNFAGRGIYAFDHIRSGRGILAGDDLHPQPIYRPFLSMLLHTNSGFSVFPSSLWTMGHHYHKSLGGHWQILSCPHAFRSGFLNVGSLNEPTLLCKNRPDRQGRANQSRSRRQ